MFVLLTAPKKVIVSIEGLINILDFTYVYEAIVLSELTLIGLVIGRGIL